MTKIKYNEKQIEELKNNSNVRNCTSKHIVFSKEFKLKAVKLANEYISAKEIFKQFGFPEYIINFDIPSNSGYIQLLKDLGVTQSMSRRGNCLDNALTESFFLHMKDEINSKDIKTFRELEKVIENYIFYYNNKRYQWNRKKMTPV